MSSKFELRPESPLVAPSAYPTISRSLDSRVHDLSATPTINTTARATLDRHHLVSPACHFSKGQLVGHYVTVGTWLFQARMRAQTLLSMAQGPTSTDIRLAASHSHFQAWKD